MTPTRDVLRDLLLQWQSDSLDDKAVHKTALKLADEHGLGPFEDSDPRALVAEILSQLVWVHERALDREDVPVVLSLLDLSASVQLDALRTWLVFLDRIEERDSQTRESAPPSPASAHHTHVDPMRLRRLLDEWKDGAIDELQVMEMCQEIIEEVGALRCPELLPCALALQVVAELDALYIQLVTVDDVPFMNDYLQLQDVRTADARWRKYWGEIDYRDRQQQLADNPNYSTSETAVEARRRRLQLDTLTRVEAGTGKVDDGDGSSG